MPQIEIDELSKTFRVPQREGGLKAALRSLIRRRYKTVCAVDRISATIEEGEVVGFLGPNGAGKTTTLKMLTGLLHPTGGTATILGHDPWRRSTSFLQSISLVMGQRGRLVWDLPVADSFLLQQAIYQVDESTAQGTLSEMIELLDLSSLLDKPVRNLSLGERMKCELCVSLLHRPRVVFLDEPTLGLDVTMQARIRQFIGEYNRRHRATIILTSHYMADVTALCGRVIVIDHGRILFDGRLSELGGRIAPFKSIVIDLLREVDGYEFDRLGTVQSKEGRRVTLRVSKPETARVTERLLADLPVLDLTIQEPPIEEVIAQVFAGGLGPNPRIDEGMKGRESPGEQDR